MRRKKLLWQLFPSYLVIILLSLLAATLYAANSIHEFYVRQVAYDLHVRGELLEGEVQGMLAKGDYEQANAWSRRVAKRSGMRVTLVLPSGKVVADSDHDPKTMDDHSDRPEIIAVMRGGVGKTHRYSYTLHAEMMYLAVPIRQDERLVGILRMSVLIAGMGEALRSIYLQIAMAGLAIGLVAAAFSLGVSRYITRPLEEMKRGTDRFASGDLHWRLKVPNTEELAVVAEGLNAMAAQLDERIRSLLQQRNEQEAVLSSMVEGVLAVDVEERVISINQACARLLGVKSGDVSGRSIQEAVRNTDLQEFVARALASREPVEGDIVLRDNGGRYLQAHGTVLHDGKGQGIGAVIVLNDVTRLHRLETVRRDFVANVSHELKTPITSIKGFVETLLEGAVNRPEDATRFLQIIARQTDRLNAIIEDILSLSRIEDQSEKDRIQMEKVRVKDVLRSAVQVCELQAKARDIDVELVCDEGLMARINGPLLEQAVVNLVDNAIKYSDPGKKVHLEAGDTGTELTISVRDMGSGIEREHLGRIFERFYRVDKARSRKLGGTGLGLAIVKHIALVHGGTVTVDSVPGQGSTFVIHLPVR